MSVKGEWREGSGGQWRKGDTMGGNSLNIFGCQDFRVIRTGKESDRGSGVGLNRLENQG